MLRARVMTFMFGLGLATVGLVAEPSSFWLDVPFVKQEEGGCGAASVAMVMQYWIKEGYYIPADQAEPKRIHTALFSREANGTRASDIEQYFRGHGFKPFAFKGDWNEMGRHLAQGRPLIVCIKPEARGSRRHYIVVAGIDAERGVVFVNDPARRKLTQLRRQSFEAEWKAANSWTLLALPAEDR